MAARVVAATTADALVLGAGIIGAACAFRLAERGLRVRVQFSEAVNVRLSWESIQEYRTFGERYGAESGYVPNGYLLSLIHI